MANFIQLHIADDGREAFMNLDAVGYFVEPPEDNKDSTARAGFSLLGESHDVIPVEEDLALIWDAIMNAGCC